jgi:hypothetical protein
VDVYSLASYLLIWKLRSVLIKNSVTFQNHAMVACRIAFPALPSWVVLSDFAPLPALNTSTDKAVKTMSALLFCGTFGFLNQFV